MNDSDQEKFARLVALSAIQTAQIKANPLPFLNEVAAENHRLRKCIQDAAMVLSGADNFAALCSKSTNRFSLHLSRS